MNELKPEKIFTGHGKEITNPAENFDYCLKKLKRFDKDPELILINNMVPTAEFFVFRNYGCIKDELLNVILKNMIKFKNEPFLKDYDCDRFPKIIEKMLALMKLLNIIVGKENKLFLSNNLNEYIS